jgi:hypothetical protein
MIFFGHIGITLLVGFLIFTFLKEKIDYRLLVIVAIPVFNEEVAIGSVVLRSIKYADISLVKKVLDYAPKVSLRDGLKKYHRQ